MSTNDHSTPAGVPDPAPQGQNPAPQGQNPVPQGQGPVPQGQNPVPHEHGTAYGSQPGPADGATPAEERESWFGRHSTALLVGMAAVVVVAAAIVGLFLHRGNLEDQNAATEAAVIENVAAQGAEVESIECEGDTCAAIISGTAYTVLVQEDGDGQRHFGVTAYVGD